MGREIRLNYPDVMRKVRKLENLADDMAYEVYKLESVSERLQGCWQGPAAKVFASKMESMQERVSAASNRMTDVTELIRYTAWKIHQADLEAEEKARQL